MSKGQNTEVALSHELAHTHQTIDSSFFISLGSENTIVPEGREVIH